MKQIANVIILTFAIWAMATCSCAQAVSDPTSQFHRVQRAGSVDLQKEYDLSDLRIPLEEIHTLLPRDAIPSLVTPATQPAKAIDWLPEQARVVLVARGDHVIGVPLTILDWHEIVNVVVAGEPLAVTYCPLCDSAAIFSRVVPGSSDAGEEAGQIVLEFGVSGALYNSNVLMYDRRNRGLWSQIAMEAVSGPLAGTKLATWPVDIVTFREFRRTHPDAPVVSRETGHKRDYGASPYENYFGSDRLMVPVRGVGEALPKKTLGIGIATESGAWFVAQGAIDKTLDVETDLGKVRLSRSDDRLAVDSAPKGVRCVQTFYYSWSAFYPKAIVVTRAEKADVAGDGKHPR